MTLPPCSGANADEVPLPPDFSLVLGGPLYQLYRRAHLSGDALELTRRRVVTITLFAWLPLLLLSEFEGHALGGGIKIPFLYDIAANVRFLIALPMLIIAEVVVHREISPLVRRFVESRIVVTRDCPSFNAAVDSVLRVRNSIPVELALLALTYTLGLWIWRSRIAPGTTTWFALPDAMHLHLTPAGYWYALVAIPLFQFILLRWYLRLALWFWLLWRLAKFDLHLSAAHPDHAAGIGFLGKSSYAFGPILFAHGALLAGVIASRVLYEGQSLPSFKMDVIGLIGLFVLLILGPLMMFTPQLVRTKLAGTTAYGTLANRYVFGFEKKWIEGGFQQGEELLGTPDIQSLADIGNSYSVVRAMRIVPFGLDDIMALVVATTAPLLPLMLTAFSAEELLTRLVKIIL